jgi:hypothetical protein
MSASARGSKSRPFQEPRTYRGRAAGRQGFAIIAGNPGRPIAGVSAAIGHHISHHINGVFADDIMPLARTPRGFARICSKSAETTWCVFCSQNSQNRCAPFLRKTRCQPDIFA